MEVGLKVESAGCVYARIAVLYNLLKVVGRDACNLIACSIVLMISLVEVYLCKEGGGCSLRRTSHLGLLNGQNLVGFLKVVDDNLPTLVVGILCVGEVVIVLDGEVGVCNERNVLVQTLEEEVAVSTEELHLSHTLVLERIGCGVELLELSQCCVDTRDAVVQTLPHIADVPVGSKDALRNLELVEHVAVGCTVAALIGVVRAHVEVPHRE